MVKPIVENITSSYRTKAEALNDGVAYENLDDRNSSFYIEEAGFSEDAKEVADYIEYSLNIMAGYVDTKLYLDEMLNNGNYLNDLVAYENRILEYHNDIYGTEETIVTDTILNNLSARQMEELTIPLTNAVVYPIHNDQIIDYYNNFRGVKTNAEVYAEIISYLEPLQQGISRVIASAAVQVFTNGTDAYNDLISYLNTWKIEKEVEIIDYLESNSLVSNVNVIASNIDDIGVNAMNINDININANNITDINTNALNIENININALNIKNINTNADNKPNIDTVANNIDNINILANSVKNVLTLEIRRARILNLTGA